MVGVLGEPTTMYRSRGRPSFLCGAGRLLSSQGLAVVAELSQREANSVLDLTEQISSLKRRAWYSSGASPATEICVDSGEAVEDLGVIGLEL
jgi:hypothetical protein